MHRAFVSSPVGILRITTDGTGITGIESVQSKGTSDPDQLTKCCAAEIEQYFKGTTDAFSVSMQAKGTAFQKSVWKEMRNIPYGTTRTYADIAKKIGKPKAVRAVGSACGKNPLLLAVPCHRVVGSNGGLGGFSAGIDKKKLLLALEQKHGNRRRMPVA